MNHACDTYVMVLGDGGDYIGPDSTDCRGCGEEQADRCGPLHNNQRCNCHGGNLYCNEKNGWCGNTAAHKAGSQSGKYQLSGLTHHTTFILIVKSFLE